MADLALDRKGLDVIVLDLRGQSSYADFLVVASGTSDRHVQSVAEYVGEELNRRGVKSMGQEGVRQGQWALVDFGPVVLHVFHQYTREVYDLEAMWREAPRLPLSATAKATTAAPRASRAGH